MTNKPMASQHSGHMAKKTVVVAAIVDKRRNYPKVEYRYLLWNSSSDTNEFGQHTSKIHMLHSPRKEQYETQSKALLKSNKVSKQISREYRAVCDLLHRSGLRHVDQLGLPHLPTSRLYHTSTPKPQKQQPPPKKDDKKPGKENEDDDKIPSLLAKAFLWMLTAYMLIAVISLLFPSSNQPEDLSLNTLWSSGQSLWLQIHRSRVKSPVLSYCLAKQWALNGVNSAS
uniref:Uncharacterized protein n=1 Tax=Timema poppense TaxID=170557 RepID=A0A7R9DQ54_TIMPO|nr:unnamed protein product [Timema poppensis]